MSVHTADPNLDPYTAQAENKEHSPIEKIDQLRSIIKAAPTGMLTTRSKDGSMHSRAMRPTQWENLLFVFVFNNASHKAEEIESDAHVNLSFYDNSTTDWVSVAGIAKISNDPIKIKENWSSFMAGYFGKVDSEHPGDSSDPRVSLIEITPINIRYWKATSGKIVRAATTAISAVTGGSSPPGELHIVTEEEIKLVRGLSLKNA